MPFFHKELILFVKSFSKSYFETTFIVGFVTFCGIVSTGIFIDVIGINNANEIEINEALSSKFILTAIAAVIFAPVVEELLFRYLIYNGLKKINPIFAHIIVGLLFGFFHVWGYVIIEREYIQLVNMLPYVVMSLGFSVIYSKTNNILCSIIVHMTINIVAVLI